MYFDDTFKFNTKLQLGLGLSLHDRSAKDCMKKKVKNPSKCKNKEYPSLTLGTAEEEVINNNHVQPAAAKTESYDQFVESSFSNSSIREMNQKVLDGDQEFEIEVEKVTKRRIGDVDEDGNPRKKLRLTKEQSDVLEENFKEHSTLNPKQKQALAKRLNLLTRQVEVWFQNRRARTKLKQTESDHEILKKCCENLTEENKRLEKELEELKSMQTMEAEHFYMQQIPAATLSICPSCERICGGAKSKDSLPSTTLLIGSKAHYHHHNYKSNYPFPHPPFINSMPGR